MTMKERKFWLSIKHKDKCLFSRRNGFKGKIIFNYSVCLRLFGINFCNFSGPFSYTHYQYPNIMKTLIYSLLVIFTMSCKKEAAIEQISTDHQLIISIKNWYNYTNMSSYSTEKVIYSMTLTFESSSVYKLSTFDTKWINDTTGHVTNTYINYQIIGDSIITNNNSHITRSKFTVNLDSLCFYQKDKWSSIYYSYKKSIL
jgi:hypothetical protein